MGICLNQTAIDELNRVRDNIECEKIRYNELMQKMLEIFLKENGLDGDVIRVDDNKIGRLIIAKSNKNNELSSYQYEFRVYRDDKSLAPKNHNPDFFGTNDLNKYFETIFSKYKPYTNTERDVTN